VAGDACTGTSSETHIVDLSELHGRKGRPVSAYSNILTSCRVSNIYSLPEMNCQCVLRCHSQASIVAQKTTSLRWQLANERGQAPAKSKFHRRTFTSPEDSAGVLQQASERFWHQSNANCQSEVPSYLPHQYFSRSDDHTWVSRNPQLVLQTQQY
jgi:hypothetical protein